MSKYPADMLFDPALSAYDKASWAKFQTGEGQRKKTIISVNHEEAWAIAYALEYYLEKNGRFDYGDEIH